MTEQHAFRRAQEALKPRPGQRPGADNPERSILFSFIGARAKPHDLTKNRNLIISELAHCSDALVIGNDNWFYDDLAYGVQISGSIQPSDPRAQGTGPNTIRLWEAIGSGAIPVVLSDTWVPPGPRELWDEAMFFLRVTPTGVRNIPERCRPSGFITDLEVLWNKRAG